MTQLNTTVTPAIKYLDYFEKITFRSVTCFIEKLYNLHWSDRGIARLASTAGYLVALARTEPDSAEAMAKSLYENLAYLNNYGGPIEFERGLNKRTYPAYRVVIGDDGCFGCFTIAWHRAILGTEKIQEVAKQLHPGADENPDHNVWVRAMQAAREKLMIRRELDINLQYRYSEDRSSSGGYIWFSEVVEYAYSFNGGLILHANEGYTAGNWSCHT